MVRCRKSLEVRDLRERWVSVSAEKLTQGRKAAQVPTGPKLKKGARSTRVLRAERAVLARAGSRWTGRNFGFSPQIQGGTPIKSSGMVRRKGDLVQKRILQEGEKRF